MRVMWEDLHSALEPYRPSAHPYGRQTLPVLGLREKFLLQHQSQQTPECPRERGPVQMLSLREKLQDPRPFYCPQKDPRQAEASLLSGLWEIFPRRVTSHHPPANSYRRETL